MNQFSLGLPISEYISFAPIISLIQCNAYSISIYRCDCGDFQIETISRIVWAYNIQHNEISCHRFHTNAFHIVCIVRETCIKYLEKKHTDRETAFKMHCSSQTYFVICVKGMCVWVCVVVVELHAVHCIWLVNIEILGAPSAHAEWNWCKFCIKWTKVKAYWRKLGKEQHLKAAFIADDSSINFTFEWRLFLFFKPNSILVHAKEFQKSNFQF